MQNGKKIMQYFLVQFENEYSWFVFPYNRRLLQVQVGLIEIFMEFPSNVEQISPLQPNSMEDQYCFEVTFNGGTKLYDGFKQLFYHSNVALRSYGKHNFEGKDCNLWIFNAKVDMKLLIYPPF